MHNRKRDVRNLAQFQGRQSGYERTKAARFEQALRQQLRHVAGPQHGGGGAGVHRLWRRLHPGAQLGEHAAASRRVYAVQHRICNSTHTHEMRSVAGEV